MGLSFVAFDAKDAWLIAVRQGRKKNAVRIRYLLFAVIRIREAKLLSPELMDLADALYTGIDCVRRRKAV